MSYVGLILQGLISVLIVAGFAYGVRLHRKLDELRNSQAGFAVAVGDLDRAAARAEAGLASLRGSTETAREELADRIDAARALVARLEQAGSDAALTLKRLEAAQRSELSSPSPMGRWREAPEGVSRASGERDNTEAASTRLAPAARTAPPALRATSPSLRDGEETELFAPPSVDATSDRLRKISELLRAPDEGDRRAGARPKVRS